MSRKECQNLIFQATVIFMVATVMFMVIVISMVGFLAEQKTMKMTVDSIRLRSNQEKKMLDRWSTTSIFDQSEGWKI